VIRRREVLAGLGALAASACAPRATSPRQPSSRQPSSPSDHLEHAKAAARFIRRFAVTTPHGLVWRKSPDEPGEMSLDLYHGSCGVALFLLELHRATGEQAALDEATATLAHIAATWADTPRAAEVGLHGGLAGHAFAMHALAHDTGDATHRAWSADAIARLDRAATPVDNGGRGYAYNDVLYGNAGVILTLLAIAPDDERGRTLAIALGDGLLGRTAATVAVGKHWTMVPGDDRELPNFSHGTAGVAYALARLYEVTHEARFLDAAVAGAEYLVSIARTGGDVCLVPHALPDGAERYYLAYCHGPAGTSRLFHQLHVVTHEARWSEWFRKSINGVLYTGLPEQRTPGFWDNVGQCCGTAAIAELALSLHRLRGEQAYRNFADELAADIARRATRANDGSLEWVHAENRAEPWWRQSYTGYMQGAAGIGSLFLRMAGHDSNLAWKISLPDNPWRTE
jgi:lantibiotic modifying enzyme